MAKFTRRANVVAIDSLDDRVAGEADDDPRVSPPTGRHSTGQLVDEVGDHCVWIGFRETRRQTRRANGPGENRPVWRSASRRGHITATDAISAGDPTPPSPSEPGIQTSEEAGEPMDEADSTVTPTAEISVRDTALSVLCNGHSTGPQRTVGQSSRSIAGRNSASRSGRRGLPILRGLPAHS